MVKGPSHTLHWLGSRKILQRQNRSYSTILVKKYTLKSKTSKAVTGEPFDKNGSNVESYLTTSERECKLQCSWTNGNNNPAYFYEDIDNSTKGRCYCKY